MLGLLAVAVVSSFRTVGTLLVGGGLVASPATATSLARRPPVVMAIAVAVGCLAVVVGLAISYHADTAASATVDGLAVAQFFLVLAVTEAVDRFRRPASRSGPPAGALAADPGPS